MGGSAPFARMRGKRGPGRPPKVNPEKYRVDRPKNPVLEL